MASRTVVSPRMEDDIIRIFAITVQLNASRSIRTVQLSIKDRKPAVSWIPTKQKALKATFESPLDISTSDRLHLELHSSFFLGASEKQKDIKISATDLLESHTSEDRQQTWKKTIEKAEVTILFSHETASNRRGAIASTSSSYDQNFPLFSTTDTSSVYDQNAPLVPTTEDILRVCPRFRILVIGKTGVGKSSLINEAFGVDVAAVSKSTPGEANINKEIFSEKNPHFVLHDSQGFEPGEINNFRTVCDFIQSRNRMPELKDKLHAIWLCIAIPVSGARVLETGVEDLLNLKREGQLGNAPIFAVFTKFDELVEREDRKLASPEYDGLSDEKLSELARKNAKQVFENECAMPFRELLGDQIPLQAVSKEYKTTLTDLVETTFEHVQRHFASPASIVTAIAQKPSPTIKIDAIIDVGKMRYWKGLVTGVNFPGKKLADCLDVIHTDIVDVWDINDPKKNLKSKEFKAMMSNLVDKSRQGKVVGNPNASLTVGVATLSAIAGIISALAGPAAPIVLPIAGSLVLAKWVYDVYEASRSNVEYIMAYIVGLTLVMQNLFCVAEGKHEASRRLIKLAFAAYCKSDAIGTVHTSIAEHVKEASLFFQKGRDTTMDMIVDLIRRHSIKSAEMFEFRDKMPNLNAKGSDEPWE